jgi:hypothetical protein
MVGKRSKRRLAVPLAMASLSGMVSAQQPLDCTVYYNMPTGGPPGQRPMNCVECCQQMGPWWANSMWENCMYTQYGQCMYNTNNQPLCQFIATETCNNAYYYTWAPQIQSTIQACISELCSVST